MWTCGFVMALPSPSLAKLEGNSLEVASLTSIGGRKEPRRRKRDQQFSGKRSTAPFKRKEQLLQLLAIFFTTAVVYKLTVAAVRLLEEARRPFCDAGHACTAE